MSQPPPSPEESLGLFRRVAQGDKVAVGLFAAAHLAPLADWLASVAPRADPHLRQQAAEDAVLSVLNRGGTPAADSSPVAMRNAKPQVYRTGEMMGSKPRYLTYIQLLADLGLVGFSLFVALVVAIATRVRELLRRLGPRSELWPPAWAMSLGLVLVIVWVNDNPLFGGEPETVVPALLIGALAATSRKVVANRLPVGEAQGAGGS